MWQRIQTVFLIIAIISLIAAIFLPIWTNKDAAGKTHVLYALHYTVIENDTRTTNYFPYSLTAIFAVASATVALIEIGKFKTNKGCFENELVFYGSIQLIPGFEKEY